MRQMKLSQIAVIYVEGVSVKQFNDFPAAWSNLKKKFDMHVEVSCPLQYECTVQQEIFRIPLSVSYIIKNHVTRKHKIVRKSVDVKVGDTAEQPCTKLQLLLNVAQLIEERCPIPDHGKSIRQTGKDREDFVPLHTEYEPVTDDSPIFTIDCEMCITSIKKSELTWLSVIDESLKVVYETHVKPYNTIIDYVTRYSGVTAACLQDVTTRVEDVRLALRKLIPRNAILCGHSISNDLIAMKLYYPYVIDSSVIYNMHGFRNAKSSLKNLTSIYLGRDIQAGGRAGHNPNEDAIATMELVQLKLKRGITFGDVILNDTNTQSFQLQGTSRYENLIDRMNNAHLPVTLAGPLSSKLTSYGSRARYIATTSDEETVQKITAVIGESYLSWTELHDGKRFMYDSPTLLPDYHDCLSTVDKNISEVIAHVKEKSLVIVLFSGTMSSGKASSRDIHNGMCFMGITPADDVDRPEWHDY